MNEDLPSPPGAGNPTPAYVYAAQLPNVTSILQNYNGAYSDYNAMQLIFARRFSSGLSFNANYTWSHGLGDNEGDTDSHNAAVDYGNTNFDIRNRVAAAADYVLPFGHDASGMRAILAKGWEANGIYQWQTGIHFTVVSQADAPNGYLYINLPTVTMERPDVIGKVIPAHQTINDWYNIDAFSPQVQGTIGTEGVNQYAGPHFRSADLSLLKNIQIHEPWRLQFRAECFNVTNTPNFGLPDFTSAAYIPGPSGVLVPAGAAQGSALGTISKTAFGSNPRQFQFALKVLF